MLKSALKQPSGWYTIPLYAKKTVACTVRIINFLQLSEFYLLLYAKRRCFSKPDSFYLQAIETK